MAKKAMKMEKSWGGTCENCGCTPEWHTKMQMWAAGKVIIGLLLLLPALGITLNGLLSMQLGLGVLGLWFAVKGVKKIARGGCC